MARWVTSVRERRRTYEGCWDLHQTRSFLAAVSGGGRTLREREPPSSEPMQEDLRICFERLEDGQESCGDLAREHTQTIATHHVIVRCTMRNLRERVKALSERDPDAPKLSLAAAVPENFIRTDSRDKGGLHHESFVLSFRHGQDIGPLGDAIDSGQYGMSGAYTVIGRTRRGGPRGAGCPNGVRRTPGQVPGFLTTSGPPISAWP